MKQISLTRGEVALVDDEDYPKLIKNKWQLWTNGKHKYAHRFDSTRNKTRPYVLMHRLILNAPNGVNIDHIDGNGLNNQKSNLRLCNQSQNEANSCISARNSSGYKGVSFSGKEYTHNPWRSRIRVHRIIHELGFFPTPEIAAIAYNNAALKYFGEYAKLNIV